MMAQCVLFFVLSDFANAYSTKVTRAGAKLTEMEKNLSMAQLQEFERELEMKDKMIAELQMRIREMENRTSLIESSRDKSINHKKMMSKMQDHITKMLKPWDCKAEKITTEMMKGVDFAPFTLPGLDEILNDGAGDQKMIPTYGYNPYLGHGAFIYPIASLICTPPGR